MIKKTLLLRLFDLVVTFACTIGASAAEAYACYTPENTTLTFYYDSERSSRPGTTYNLNVGEYQPSWYNIRKNVTKVVFASSFESASPSTTYRWFLEMENLQSITGIGYLNTFNVTNMNGMFYGCSSLTSLDLNGLNTSRVTSMDCMFRGCSSLTSLNVDYINTVNVTDMCEMFADCSSLTSINLNHFNTAKVEDMEGMFNGCSSLTSLGLSSFNTANVTNMAKMFYKCSSLTTIYAGDDWSTENVYSSSYMFEDCYNLVGGKGTTYRDEWQPHDKTYARIDGVGGNPGFFTQGKKAYAYYDTDSHTLHFCFDYNRDTWSGTYKTYDLNVDKRFPEWQNDGINSSVKWVEFEGSFYDYFPTSTFNWFYNMQNLKGFISHMFNLQTEAVTDMTDMFYGCSSLTSLDLSFFDTANVTDMYCMFYGCSSLSSLDFSTFNTEKVEDMEGMFGGCSSLTSLDLGFFNTANVTTMEDMFNGCSGLTSLDLSSFNTEKVQKMGYMFNGCSSLATIYAGDGWNTGAVWSHDKMFTGCTSLIGGAGTTYDSNHTGKEYARIDGGPTSPGYFTEGKEAYACYTPSDHVLTFYCDYQRGLRPGATYDLNEGNNNPGWLEYRSDITKVVFDPSFAAARPTSTFTWFYYMGLQSITGMQYLNASNVTTMTAMFYGCSSLTSLDLSHFNTSNVTDMTAMFAGCSSLTSLDLSSFNTSNVTSMENMFAGCTALTSLDLSSFNTSNVIIMKGMFYNCSALPTLNVSSFNTSKVTTMEGMFYNCSALTSLDLSSFNTSNVTTMASTFCYCRGLTSLNVSSFNTSNVTNMNSLFAACSALPILDLTGFNTAKVTDMRYMFIQCGNLMTIYAGQNWNTAAATNSGDMFTDCTSLVGGMGTAYSASNPKDKTYARIDGGPNTPGYFSEKPQSLLGDLDGSGIVDVEDVNAAINIILKLKTINDYPGNGDMDGNGYIDVEDVNAIINIILKL